MPSAYPAAGWLYLLALPAAALVVALWTAWTALTAPLASDDLITFAVLLLTGGLAVESRRRLPEPAGTSANDALSIWWLPVACLLPPVYTALAAVCLIGVEQWRLRRAPLHRRVVTAAVVTLAYGGASAVLHGPLAGIAGGEPAAGARLLPWVGVLLLAGAGALVLNALLLAPAIRVEEPGAGWRELLWDRESLQRDAVELCTGAVVAILVALSPYLALLALPQVLLVQRGMLHAQLRAAARLDDKTGLLNAVSWEREATAELDKQRRRGKASAVLLLDIDHFKRVNDTYGHLVGDQVLRSLADALRSSTRDQDLVGRFGGEEFAVLLPDVEATAARAAAERIRARVAAIRVPVDADALVRITVSVGVAVSEPLTLTVAELLAAADHGLYLAKAAGRDRVGVAVELERRH